MKALLARLDWTDAHYVAAAACTLTLIGVYAVTKKVDPVMATFTLGLWGTATADNRFNTPNPNLNVSAFNITGVTSMVPPKVD